VQEPAVHALVDRLRRHAQSLRRFSDTQPGKLGRRTRGAVALSATARLLACRDRLVVAGPAVLRGRGAEPRGIRDVVPACTGIERLTHGGERRRVGLEGGDERTDAAEPIERRDLRGPAHAVVAERVERDQLGEGPGRLG
jgi:hypothetical protein